MTNAPVQVPEAVAERVTGLVYGGFTAALIAAAGTLTFLTFLQFAPL